MFLTSKLEPHEHTFLLPVFTLTPAKFGSTSNTVFASSLLQPRRLETLNFDFVRLQPKENIFIFQQMGLYFQTEIRTAI